VTHPYASTYTEKQNTGTRTCIYKRYGGFEPVIPVESVNIFAVYYSHKKRHPVYGTQCPAWTLGTVDEVFRGFLRPSTRLIFPLIKNLAAHTRGYIFT